MSRQLILIDAFAFIYRAFHALPDLRTKDNRPTGAVRGIINMVEKLSKDYQNSAIIMVYDPPGKTFRDEIFAQYKAQRPPMPDDLRQQLQPIKDCVEALGIPSILIEGFEADDIIGSIAKQYCDTYQIIIASGDKDMAQLVANNILQYNPLSNKTFGTTEVIEKFGVTPKQIIDYLAIVGDSADNIPGITGVGEKTAVPLLKAFVTVEGVYENLDQICNLSFRGAKTLAAKIEQYKEQAMLSKTLATIKTDIFLNVDIATFNRKQKNVEQLKTLYRQLEFNQLYRKLTENNPDERLQADGKPQTTDVNYRCIDSLEQWQQWLTTVKQHKIFAFDTETTSLNELDAELVGIAMAVAPKTGVYIPLAHDAGKNLDFATIKQDIVELLTNKDMTVVGQNLKYDLKVLVKYGIEFQDNCIDTMLLASLINTASRTDMNSLALRYLNHQCISFTDIAGKGKHQKTFNQIAIKQATTYAAEDADITLRLYYTFQELLQKTPQLLELYKNLDWPLAKVLATMELNGIHINAEYLDKLSVQFAEQILKLEQQAYGIAGQDFNLSSPVQLGQILYNKLNLPVLQKTPKGAPSTAEEALIKLKGHHQLPEVILQYRSLTKLRSTYTTKLVAAIHPKTNRIHSSFNQTIASTGRLSSTNPNIQNIPIRNDNGRKIRQAFIAKSNNHSILAADYSQIELRIMAHLSKDNNLITAFAEGRDVHQATAAEVFNLSLDAVQPEHRRRAKAVNFGLIYGMSAFGLAKQLGENQKQAQSYIDLYFARYPKVLAYMDDIKAIAKQQGFVETILGRRIYLPTINDKNANFRKAAERTAINAPMQGSAAEIIKLAMLDIDNWLQTEKLQTLMTMQVHDELVFEVANSELELVKSEVKMRMQRVLADELSIPLIVDIGIANNWNDAH